uniref:NADH-ubiquinone oxidoreductase chain 4 n=1 Tax=Garra poecilura TaxID=643390 RepID=A0A1E1FMS5_9TELE|nr:NADH dehydrogenase subunit 4 [Garra poecilura]BAV71805.1 NADH dehydrogenase subunit 4 [Garra poecilura]
MLKVLIPMTMLTPTIWLIPFKWLWATTVTYSLLIALISLTWLSWTSETGWTLTNTYMAIDPLSSPLLVLTCWLLPLMILASQNHLSAEPEIRQRAYITALTLLQATLIMAFGATELAMFYIMFEATLIPTLIIITRWGANPERLIAGTYFMFYTLAGSMPLLVSLFTIQKTTGTLSMMIIQYSKPLQFTPFDYSFLWAGCLMAFLVKMPLYGIHLWLPKAHVEAPVAGSMVLAAILLKLGGYGMMRMMAMLTPPPKQLIYLFIILALWGIVMTSSMCLRQTDTKLLIAYSSVSHMGLVVGGILSQTPWGFSGALILMISHGLVSSALFCLANTMYERTGTRTLIMTRGLQMALPLATTWWLIASLANMAIPPLPNLMGEITIITTLFKWSPWTILLTGLGTLITAGYSMYLLTTSQRGPLPNHLTGLELFHSREHLLLILHLAPILLLVLKPELIWGWCY